MDDNVDTSRDWLAWPSEENAAGNEKWRIQNLETLPRRTEIMAFAVRVMGHMQAYTIHRNWDDETRHPDSGIGGLHSLAYTSFLSIENSALYIAEMLEDTVGRWKNSIHETEENFSSIVNDINVCRSYVSDSGFHMHALGDDFYSIWIDLHEARMIGVAKALSWDKEMKLPKTEESACRDWKFVARKDWPDGFRNRPEGVKSETYVDYEHRHKVWLGT